ncbi:hypothetical protein BGZ72_010831 [Mortierella alpina]|nr:hypothetical protein BGZ72_010831 [Mortierella alpina]
MPKTKTATPPGTGYVGCLTLEQKQCLKDTWAAVLTFLVATESTTDSRKPTKPSKKNRSIRASKPAPGRDICTDYVAELVPENSGDYGLYGVALREALWSNALGDHPDALFLRFLRYHDWNVERGLDMLMKGLRWRVDFGVGELATKNEDELDKMYASFKHQLRTGKVFIYGRDKTGRVVVYIRARLHKASDQPKATTEKFLVYVLECIRLLLYPHEEACVVLDLAGLSIGNTDSQFIKFAIQCVQNHYPGSVGLLVVLDPPLAFQGIWKAIRPWLSSSFAAKVRFERKETDLLKYIAAETLPSMYEGGKAQYNYEYVAPFPRENACMKDTATKELLRQRWRSRLWRLEALLREWVTSTATETEHARSEEVIEAELEETVKAIRVAYFKLRPYIHARTLYERTEYRPLRQDGEVVWS